MCMCEIESTHNFWEILKEQYEKASGFKLDLMLNWKQAGLDVKVWYYSLNKEKDGHLGQ